MQPVRSSTTSRMVLIISMYGLPPQRQKPCSAQTMLTEVSGVISPHVHVLKGLAGLLGDHGEVVAVPRVAGLGEAGEELPQIDGDHAGQVSGVHLGVLQ